MEVGKTWSHHRGGQPENRPAGDRANGPMEAEGSRTRYRAGASHEAGVHSDEKRVPRHAFILVVFLGVAEGVSDSQEIRVSYYRRGNLFYVQVRRHQHRTMVRPKEPSCTLAGFPPLGGTDILLIPSIRRLTGLATWRRMDYESLVPLGWSKMIKEASKGWIVPKRNSAN